MVRYRIKNWEEHQHYKNRNPTWIKLHFSLLSSQDWVVSDDSTRVLAIACMLLASKTNGEIDGSPSGLEFIRRVAYLNNKPDLKPLIESGFIVPIACNGENIASTLHTNARPEKRREEIEKRQRESKRREDICPEPEVSDSGPNEPGVSVLTFPCTGPVKEWHLIESKVAEWSETYDTLDIEHQCRLARQWVTDNPGRRKTAKGMTKFLNGWLARAAERNGRGNGSLKRAGEAEGVLRGSEEIPF